VALKSTGSRGPGCNDWRESARPSVVPALLAPLPELRAAFHRGAPSLLEHCKHTAAEAAARGDFGRARWYIDKADRLTVLMVEVG
jgi:hypothetical protein